MKVATFNINSINAHMDCLQEFLHKENPDIILLQEIKTEFNNFPFFELQALGFNAKILGQKSYNGVAVLSPHKIEVKQENLPNFSDENARYLECEITVNNKKIRVASIYLPNGNPPYNNPDDTSKFSYKLNFMDSLHKHAKQLLLSGEYVILGGDFNVIFTDYDVYNPELFRNNALMREEVRERFVALQYAGWYDAFRLKNPHDRGYTYWDYGGGSFAADFGMRIDYMLLSPAMADNLTSCKVAREIRAMARPSDHTPLVAEFGGF